MPARIALSVMFAFAATAALFAPPGAAADDPPAAAPVTSAQQAPNYDSNYKAGVAVSGAGDNTPESDARPGERYFLEGVRAFQKKEYTFAIQMYQVAASWAYKPAEYNLGVIYARGQGVPVDLPRAMAWMTLAAERNEQRYVDAREAVKGALTPEQLAQSESILADLSKTYADSIALRRAKAQWAFVKSHMTGSRVGSSGHLQVGMADGSGNHDSAKVAGGGMGQQVRQGARSTSTTPGEVAGGQAVDGSLAYKQLFESDDPYDPKFEREASGKAIVGAPVETGAAKPADKPDPEKHDR